MSNRFKCLCAITAIIWTVMFGVLITIEYQQLQVEYALLGVTVRKNFPELLPQKL